MILVLCTIPMGKRHHANTRIRGLKEATAAVVLIQHGNGDFTCGVGILHPDTEHLNFKEIKTFEPEVLWRGMYAASKTNCISDQTLSVAISIADVAVKIDDPRFSSDACCLRYDYDAPILRAETLAQEPPQDDIKKIVAGFKRWNLPINDPFEVEGAPVKKSSWGFFPPLINIGIESLATI